MGKSVDVAVGVLVETRDGHPFVLIARRPAESVLGGYWELPGGKIEPDETLQQCLAREFEEELAVTVCVGEALPVVEYTYDHAHVRLHPYYCTRTAGEPRNVEVAEHRWIRAEELSEYRFPAANSAMIAEVVDFLTAKQ